VPKNKVNLELELYQGLEELFEKCNRHINNWTVVSISVDESVPAPHVSFLVSGCVE